MQNSLFVALSIFSAALGTVGLDNTPLQYRYEIRANSNSPYDIKKVYDYKEKLIDTFETLIFDLDENSRLMAVKQNLQRFEFDNGKSKLVSGVIVIDIGSGRGFSIKGNLRASKCDEDVIREKLFIFDLFK